MKSIRKTLVGILTITLLAGVMAQISRANTDPPAQDFLTGKWEGEQWGRWVGKVKLTLKYDAQNHKVAGNGEVYFAEKALTVRLNVEGESRGGNAVRLKIHYDRPHHPHDITYNLTYEKGMLKGSGTNPRGQSVSLELKTVD